MRRFRWFAALCVALVGAGCTTHIRAADPPALARTATPVRVAVVRLADARPAGEVAFEPKWLEWWDATRDSRWDDKDVPEAISRTLAQYLETAGLYAQVRYEPLRAEEIGSEQLNTLAIAGYDLVLVGRLEHFRGTRRQDVARGLAAGAAGPIGSTANVVLGHHVDAEVAFRPVRALGTRDGREIWSGEAAGAVTDVAYFPGDAKSYAIEALTKAMADMATRLDRDAALIAAATGTVVCERPAPPASKPRKPNLLDHTASTLKGGARTVQNVVVGLAQVLDSAVAQVTSVLPGTRQEGEYPAPKGQ